MKKFVLFLIAALLSTAVFAQTNVSWYDLYGSVVLKGGYNFLEKQPVASLDVRADIGFVRAQIELNYAHFDGTEMPLIAFSPAFGLTYGDEHVFYLLVGGQPWGALVTRDGKTKRTFEEWHFKLEGGVDFRLSDLMFINVSLAYLLPRQNTETLEHNQNLSLMAGLGFNF